MPTLCIIGGCNGAGKTTLARELLPRMGLMRFLMKYSLKDEDPKKMAIR